MADHTCLKTKRSECPGCIESQARQSARMRGDVTKWADYMDEAKIIVRSVEQYVEGNPS